jgi:hypothetical protein
MLRNINEDPDVLNLVLMRNKAHFHVSFMNKQNIRHWAPVNPRELHKQPLHSPKVTVWCGVGTFAIEGPFFFENDNVATVTVTAEQYVAKMQNFLLLQLVLILTTSTSDKMEPQHTLLDAVWKSSTISSIRLVHILETCHGQHIHQMSQSQTPCGDF